MGTGALSVGGMAPTLAMSVTGVHLVHLTFTLLPAFGLAGTDALDAFFYLARTDALSLLTVVRPGERQRAAAVRAQR